MQIRGRGGEEGGRVGGGGGTTGPTILVLYSEATFITIEAKHHYNIPNIASYPSASIKMTQLGTIRRSLLQRIWPHREESNNVYLGSNIISDLRLNRAFSAPGLVLFTNKDTLEHSIIATMLSKCDHRPTTLRFACYKSDKLNDAFESSACLNNLGLTG